jgi:predicted dehydrogenase
MVESATEKLRVAIAGCHRMVQSAPGSHNFAAAFAAVPQLQVAAVFDRGADTRAQFVDCWEGVWGRVPAYDDYERMLEQVEPDLVCIATRQTQHAGQIEQAVRAGVRGVLCDKPLATSLVEADRIAAACRDVPLLLALDRRWVEGYQAVRRLIAAGEIGEITSLIAYGLPNLINHGCHWYDTMLALAGDLEPLWVGGLVDDVAGESEDSLRRLDPPGRGQIGLANGLVLYFTPDGKHQNSSISFEVIGESGRLFLFDDARESYIWRGGEGSLEKLELPGATGPWPAGAAMVQDLVQAVQTGGRTACDVEQVRRATEIGFAIHLSSRRDGARVTLPAEERSLCVESFPWGNE